MTVNFKTLRADLRHFLNAVGNGESFRTTGDCSLHHTPAREA